MKMELKIGCIHTIK